MRTALQTHTVRFAVDLLLSMDETRTKILGFDGAPSFYFDVMQGDLRNKRTRHPDDDNGEDL